ncbi:MAG: phosphopentomutase, partial [Lachnospiraceae bacterium]|nr:phosphopentomutase [Lachnospiraceae bacterium]
MSRRVILIVMDSFGVGALPDSKEFGDIDVNTIRSCMSSPQFAVDHLAKLGLLSIDGVSGLPYAQTYFQTHDLQVKGAYARLAEASRGKDTTTGHWEIGGLISAKPFPTYPDGFPKEILDAFSEKTGRGILCNLPYSGTQVINDYGDEHVKTGDLIVYTSADSVFQIAAHEEIVPLETLYEYCRIARDILQGEHGVGRVIARPFVGESG